MDCMHCTARAALSFDVCVRASDCACLCVCVRADDYDFEDIETTKICHGINVCLKHKHTF